MAGAEHLNRPDTAPQVAAAGRPRSEPDEAAGRHHQVAVEAGNLAHQIATYLIAAVLGIAAWLGAATLGRVEDALDKLADQLAALSSEVRSLSVRVDGEVRAQTITDGNQDRRLDMQDARLGRLEDRG